MYHLPLDRELQTLQNMVLTTLVHHFAKRSPFERTDPLRSGVNFESARKHLKTPIQVVFEKRIWHT